MLTFTVVHALSVGYVPQRGLPSVATGRLAAGHVSMVTTLKEGTLGADLSEDPMFLDEEQALQAQGFPIGTDEVCCIPHAPVHLSHLSHLSLSAWPAAAHPQGEDLPVQWPGRRVMRSAPEHLYGSGTAALAL